jgi:hypothetical protein
MSEVQWAMLAGFILGTLVGAGIMVTINLYYIRGIMVKALTTEASGDGE